MVSYCNDASSRALRRAKTREMMSEESTFTSATARGFVSQLAPADSGATRAASLDTLMLNVTLRCDLACATLPPILLAEPDRRDVARNDAVRARTRPAREPDAPRHHRRRARALAAPARARGPRPRRGVSRCGFAPTSSLSPAPKPPTCLRSSPTAAWLCSLRCRARRAEAVARAAGRRGVRPVGGGTARAGRVSATAQVTASRSTSRTTRLSASSRDPSPSSPSSSERSSSRRVFASTRSTRSPTSLLGGIGSA